MDLDILPHQFKNLRERWNISVEILSGFLQISQEDIIKFESGTSTIPKHIVKSLEKINRDYDNWSNRLTFKIEGLKEWDDDINTVAIVSYDDATDIIDNSLFPSADIYRTCIRDTIDHLVFVDAFPVKFEKEKYQNWLGDNEDTEESRFAWASTELQEYLDKQD